MHDTEHATLPNSAPWNGRRSCVWGVGLLLGCVVLFATYLWFIRESTAVQPVRIVTLRPMLDTPETSLEVVPYQHEIEPSQPDCSATTTVGGICFIIGTGNPAPAPMTFT